MYKRYGTIYRERLVGVDVVSVHDLEDFIKVFLAQGEYPARAVNEANVYRRQSKEQTYNTVGLVDS